MTEVQAHAERQEALYRSIWEADPKYGTRQADVTDTVLHRIIPHMQRVRPLGEPNVRDPRVVIDFGAGDGRFLKTLHVYGECDTGIGIDVHEPGDRPLWLQWHRQVLWAPAPRTPADYVISTDTLEHMPPAMVPAVLENIAAAAPHGFLRISTKQDIYGTERGLHLHETVEEPDWWLARCRDAGIEPTSWRVYLGHAVEVWW